MADIQTLLAAQDRTLRLRGSCTLSTGSVRALAPDDILSCTVDEGAENALCPGDVLSAKLTLSLNRQNFTASEISALTGSSISLRIEALDNSDWRGTSLGVYRISSAQAQEGEPEIQLSGSDALDDALEVELTNTLSYPSTLGQLWEHLLAQTSYTWSQTIPNASGIIDAKPEWSGAYLRRGLGLIAAAAGCFIRLDRSGNLALVPCHNPNASERAISTQQYYELSRGAESFGALNKLVVETCPDSRSQRSTIVLRADASIPDSVLNTLTVRHNTLFVHGRAHVQSLAQGMLDTLAGLQSDSMKFSWRGDPSLCIGDKICLTDTSGTALHGILTRQTLQFRQGFSAHCVCATLRDTASDAGRAVTSDGNLNADMLIGTVQGDLLAAESVTAAKLAAGSVTADKIVSGTITADRLDATTVNAQTISAVNAEINRISTGEVTTADLYAGFGKIIKLAADEIDAGHLATDALAAKLGEFVKVYADTAGIGYADIKDLVTGTAIITTGQADELYIARLSVTAANMVSLSVGKLLLQGTDGNMYQLTVDDSGNVSTVLRQVTNSDIADGTIDAGEKILSGSITADQLNVQSIFASSALINAIKASNIDTADLFANNAFISSLNAWNIWSNDYMQLSVKKSDLETYLRLTSEGVIIGKTDSGVRMVLTNSNLRIQENGNALATFGSSKLNIPRGEFTNALLLGNFAFSPQADGGLTLLVR